MFRQTSSRNHRNKGFRVKHALQIFLLLAVCVWLLYQVKHSHDKKKAFEEINERISNKVESIETSHEMLKLGRKDLDRRAEMATQNKKHKEEENEEEDEEDHKQEEPEDEDHKQEEPEDEERGVGDDEIDEQDRERVDEEAERGEDLVDEEDKEAQENDENDEKEEAEEKDSQFDNTGTSDDQDLDGGDKTTQEAREEHYKGDDASSAVVRDNQMIRPVVENGAEENLSEEHQQVDNAEMNGVENTVGRETQMVGSAIENEGSENLNEEQKVHNTENHNVESDNKLNSTEEQHVENTEKNDVENNYKTNSTEQQQVERSEMNGLENYNRSNNTSDENAYQNNSGPKVNEIPDVSGGDAMANNPLVNATTNEGKVADIITSKSENEFLSTSMATDSNKQTELHNNATIENAGTHGLNSQNESTILDSTQDQNATANSINSEHGDSNSQSAVLEQNGNSRTTWVPTQSLATNDKEVEVKMGINENEVDKKVERNGSDQGDSNSQTSSLEQREKSDSTNVSEGSDENNATVDANAEAVQPENTDSSGSLVSQEVKDALTDLGTLPQTETGGKNTEDVAAE